MAPSCLTGKSLCGWTPRVSQTNKKENAMSANKLYRHRLLSFAVITPALVLVGCGSVPQQSTPEPAPAARTSPPKSSTLPALPPAGSGRGGYYMDDGPGDMPPENLLATPDAEPKIEPYSQRGNRPYVVFGKQYMPITDERPFRQRGVGSWYGRKFHGQKTSSGEPYDMYKMTAAHPTLPIPSYARVTNLANGNQVIVRVNDRGPFHSGRIIDLSYTAALKLGYLGKGSSELEVERLLPEDIARIADSKKEQSAVAASPVTNLTPRTEIVAAPSISSPAVGAPGFYLQLGTYSQAGNAEAARAQLAQNAAFALPSVEVVESGTYFRVFSGPFASRAEAATAALRLQDAGSAKPMIVQR
jgi:rare lipoprotein A